MCRPESDGLEERRDRVKLIVAVSLKGRVPCESQSTRYPRGTMRSWVIDGESLGGESVPQAADLQSTGIQHVHIGGLCKHTVT